MNKFVAQCSEVGSVAEIFCENFWYVQFPRNVEDVYFFEVEIYSDVIIAKPDEFHPLCSE